MVVGNVEGSRLGLGEWCVGGLLAAWVSVLVSVSSRGRFGAGWRRCGGACVRERSLRRSWVVWPPHVCTGVPAGVNKWRERDEHDGRRAACGAVWGPRNAQER